MLAQPQKKKKNGLHVNSVSKDHWSVGGHVAKTEGTRLVVTILHGKGLLASDAYNGKSDPICFLWCGPSPVLPLRDNAVDDFMAVTDEDECANIGILRTKVCPTTLEPIWNEDIIFPLTVDDTFSLSQLCCIIYVRDEDIDEVDGDMNVTSYDELGMCEINLKDILINGKARKQSIVDVSRQLDLRSSPKMKKRAQGYIKITCTLIFDETDTKRLYPEVGDGIKTLDVFLAKYQMLMRERHEKENGTPILWGRAPSPQTGSRRTLSGEVGTGPSDVTFRSSSRTSRTGRSRSPLTPQVAARIRTSSTNPESDRSDEDERGRNGHAGVPKLTHNGPGLCDILEGMEGDDVGDIGVEDDDDEAELLILPMYTEEGEEEEEEEEEEVENDNYTEYKHQLTKKQPSVQKSDEPESFYNEDALNNAFFQNYNEKSKIPQESARSARAFSYPPPDKRTLPISASAPAIGEKNGVDDSDDDGSGSHTLEKKSGGGSSSGLGNLKKSYSKEDRGSAQGNATAAARVLRVREREKETEMEMERDQKQQSIKYLSKLSHENILELTQLLQAMEVVRKEKGQIKVKEKQNGIGSYTPDCDTPISVTKGKWKKGVEVRKLPIIKSKEIGKQIPEMDKFVRKPHLVTARPELKEFKRQQQEARRIAREADFFKAQTSSGSGSNSNSKSSCDSKGMPIAELLLRAPNSNGIIRATLGPEGMTLVPRDGDGDGDRCRDGDFAFSPHGGDESLPLPSASSPSTHTADRGTSKDEEVDDPFTRRPQVSDRSKGRLSDLPMKPERNAAISNSASSSNSSSSSGLNWDAVHQYLDAKDTVAAFSLVLERGELEDLARVMELVGPRPHLLSQSVRNRVYDGIATILSQPRGSEGRENGCDRGDSNEEERMTERCLYWILALLRGSKLADHNNVVRSGSDKKQLMQFREGVGIDKMGRTGIVRNGSLADTLSGHTKRDLRESLDKVSREESKRGLLAALLTQYF